MKKIILKNKSVVFRLSDKEQKIYTSRHELKLLKEEKIADLVYGGDESIYKLFSLGKEYIFDIGGTVYYLSKDTFAFDFIVLKARNFQQAYRYRFLSKEKIEELMSETNIKKCILSFCTRNQHPIRKITSKDLKNEILELQDASLDYNWEYLSIIIANQRKKFIKTELYNFSGVDRGYSFVMMDELGNKFSPVDSLVKIFESAKIYSYY